MNVIVGRLALVDLCKNGRVGIGGSRGNLVRESDAGHIVVEHVVHDLHEDGRVAAAGAVYVAVGEAAVGDAVRGLPEVVKLGEDVVDGDGVGVVVCWGGGGGGEGRWGWGQGGGGGEEGQRTFNTILPFFETVKGVYPLPIKTTRRVPASIISCSVGH